MFITGPKAWISIAGAKETACATNMYNTCGILNKSKVFVRIDLSWLLESMEGNKRETLDTHRISFQTVNNDYMKAQ